MSVRVADLWDVMRGALAARALAIVADLAIADALAAGPRPVDDLAREAGADAQTLRRLLRALASEGIFVESPRGVFANTPASEQLRDEGVRAFAHLFGGSWHRAAGDLRADGEPSFPRLYGAEFWPWLAEHPEEREAFDVAMATGNTGRVDLLDALEWRGDETVVDVGGGNGSLLLELLARRAGLRGVVFDLPETNRDEASWDERLTFAAGSFFESVPPGDVYVLSTILHDWDDERATAILRTIRAAATPESRLVVIDAVVPEGNAPHGAKWLDLLMLALFGGHERDEGQWRELLGAGGWEPVHMEDRLIEARCR